MNNNVELVKSKADIVDIVSSYIEIKKSGSNYKGLCPFHNEKGASFMVNQNLQIYKCFGCGESGDVITFVEKIEGVDFKGALRILADKYNIKLSEEKVSENDILKKRIYEINNLTLEFFNHLLLNHSAGKVGLDYLLSKRNLKKETIEEFKLGYAPKDWSTLCDFLKKRGFTESEIIASNLGIAKKTGGVYDKFRGRVVFPYYSLDGKVIGFMGRTIFDEDPKYLNSSDTAVFKKGEFLYGLYKTKLDIKKNGAVIVEGTMDFLKPYQNGFKNLVATSGTALTNQQLEILKRYTDKIFFCFDTDNAGINAILRGIEISDKYNFDVKVISIPKKFKDLDEYFDIEPENAIDLSSNAIDINDFLLAQLYRKYDYSTATGKRKIVDDFKLYYSRIENGILKNHYVKKLAEDLELEESVIRKSLTTDVPTELPKKYSNNQEKTYENPLKALESTKEYLFLALLVRSSLDIVKPIVLKFPDDCFLNLELKDLYRKFKVYLQNLGDKINIQIFSKDLNSDEKNLLEGLMLYEARGDFNSIDKTIEELEKLANFLKEDYKKSRIKEISDQIKKAEKEKNLDQVKILMEELSKFLK
jgi:DNA primase